VRTSIGLPSFGSGRPWKAIGWASAIGLALLAPGVAAAQSRVTTVEWVKPPQATTFANGLLRGGRVLAKDGDEPVPGVQLRVVIGDRADVLGTEEALAGAVVTTGSDGTASLDSVRIAGGPRQVYLTVQADGGATSRVVSVTNPPATADSIQVVQKPNDDWENGVPLSPPPRVEVRSGGLPVGGVKVTFALESGGAQVTGNEAVSDSLGVAVFPDLRLTAPCLNGGCRDQILVGRAGTARSSTSYTVKLRVQSARKLDLQSELPRDLMAGQLLRPAVRLLVSSANGTPIPGAVVVARDPFGKLLGTAAADANGQAMFSTLKLSGQAGPTEVSFTAGAADYVAKLTLLPGRPRSITVVSQPPGRVAFDSTWAARPVVEVRDADGNPVPGVGVRAFLCVRKLTFKPMMRWRKPPPPAPFDCRSDVVGSYLATLVGGATSVHTNVEGRAAFDSLRLQGREGEYLMTYVIDAEPSVKGASSGTIVHDPKRDFDQNFVVISAIKTVSGVAPENEFFDLRFRFRLSRFLHLLANTDIALTSRGTDSVASKQKRLTEAALLTNGNLWMPRANVSDVPQRLVFAGTQLKVFNTVPYWGAQIGGTELGGSAFHGSMLTVSYLRRWYGDELVVVDGDSVFTAKNNIGLDFFLRSSAVEFFKVLTIRGGVVVPLRSDARLTSRIAIAIPVGDLYRF
jgi:hypothetical protein